MKKIILFFCLVFTVLSTLLFQITTYSQMNFPLHVGNKFIYYYTWEYWYPVGGEWGSYRTAYRVIKDSTFNNHKYYMMNAYPCYTSANTWVRFDSVTKSIYAYDSTNSCSYYFKETLIDSLAMQTGTANSCSGKIFDWSRTDTIYGVVGTTKSFNRYRSETRKIRYNSNFGIIRYEEYVNLGSYGSDNIGTMIGCFINGIKYGDTALTNIRGTNTNVLDEFRLSQNYPNPFNPTTNIKFQIKNDGFVTLKVYDILGKEVATLVNEKLKPGEYETTFSGSGLASGVYFYKLTVGDFTDIKRMVLIK
jgi:hypothetical protein